MAGQRAYTIQIHPKAAKELAALPKKAQRQVDRRIQSLALNPKPPKSEHLKDPKHKGLRKWRSGNYRIFYDVQDVVLIVLMCISATARMRIGSGDQASVKPKLCPNRIIGQWGTPV